MWEEVTTLAEQIKKNNLILDELSSNKEVSVNSLAQLVKLNPNSSEADIYSNISIRFNKFKKLLIFIDSLTFNFEKKSTVKLTPGFSQLPHKSLKAKGNPLIRQQFEQRVQEVYGPGLGPTYDSKKISLFDRIKPAKGKVPENLFREILQARVGQNGRFDQRNKANEGDFGLEDFEQLDFEKVPADEEAEGAVHLFLRLEPRAEQPLHPKTTGRQ